MSRLRSQSMNEAVFPSSTVNVRRLLALRGIAVFAQALAIWFAVEQLGWRLPLSPLALVLALSFGTNAIAWLRSRAARPLRDLELVGYLAFDVLALTLLLYFTGGSTNPFATLYLLPLALTAAAFSGIYIAFIAGLAIVCYSTLLFVYVPLPTSHAGHNEDFRLHVIGMWLVFLLSACLIAWFAGRMSAARREHDRLRVDMRERELRHERVLALGTFAAGAAHELATPLSTIAVVVKEMEREASAPANRLTVLRDQITRCKDILASLSAGAGQPQAQSGGRMALDRYLDEVLARWRMQRATVTVRQNLVGSRPAPVIVAEQTLSQALTNILNNAADVSAGDVEIDVRWTNDELNFEVRDRGPGLTPSALAHAGEPFFTTKAPGEGMGLGLFLVRGTLERLQGRIDIANRDGGGAVCRVWLPLSTLRVSDT